jgi:ssDNA-binding Zn-finger/Zn-ribbon topoisomerase 1
MTFRPEALRGGEGQARAGGVIDYRLARMSVVSEYRKGRLARHEVCDAHPELKRAAQSASEPTEMECPICEEANIVLVTYAFGARLPASGRCITSKGELAKLAKGRSQLAAYVVEVCPACSWNHLAKTFLLGTG